MNPLFAKPSLMILESLAFTHSLYAFDFDGTLSRIVRVPGDATISSTTAELLRELCALVPVAIVSGRSVNDLRDRLPFRPPYLIGNHGLEGLGDNHDTLREAEQACRTWIRALRKTLGEDVELEDKQYSLALHFRRSRNKKQARQRIHQAIATLSPEPRVITGKSVVNLLPAGAPHKGVAVSELMKRTGARHAFYIGDDDTDEDVFSLPDSRIAVTVRVGQKKASNARFYIRRQSEINRVLRCLIRFHTKGARK